MLGWRWKTTLKHHQSGSDCQGDLVWLMAGAPGSVENSDDQASPFIEACAGLHSGSCLPDSRSIVARTENTKREVALAPDVRDQVEVRRAEGVGGVPGEGELRAGAADADAALVIDTQPVAASVAGMLVSAAAADADGGHGVTALLRSTQAGQASRSCAHDITPSTPSKVKPQRLLSLVWYWLRIGVGFPPASNTSYTAE